MLRIQRLGGNSVVLDEVAHHEPPHQDLRCLQIQLFSSLVPKELIVYKSVSKFYVCLVRCKTELDPWHVLERGRGGGLMIEYIQD